MMQLFLLYSTEDVIFMCSPLPRPYLVHHAAPYTRTTFPVPAAAWGARGVIRFVRLRVPQWREDVLGWIAKRGYEETGGGLWGEMDGEDAMELTRPTRYFIMTVREPGTYSSTVWYLQYNQGQLHRLHSVLQ